MASQQEQSQTNPTTIFRHAYAVYPPIAMLAGMQLDVFTPLKDGPMAATALAHALGMRTEKLRPLLYSLALATKTARLKEKIAKLKEEMQRLHALEAGMLATPDQQISLTDPDARSMATSGRGSGVVGYNVQVAVDIEHHLIV